MIARGPPNCVGGWGCTCGFWRGGLGGWLRTSGGGGGCHGDDRHCLLCCLSLHRCALGVLWTQYMLLLLLFFECSWILHSTPP